MSNPWVDDEDLDVETDNVDMPEDSQEQSPGKGTPLPHMDPEIAAELLAEGPPQWFGVRWREIGPEDQWEAWNGLRRWVDWLVHEYRVSQQEVPSCWYHHPDITAELYAAMCMEYKVWEEESPNLSPMMFWHPNLQQMLYRVRAMTEKAGCANNGGHKEPTGYKAAVGAFERDYDETDWRMHASTTRRTELIDRPETGVRYVRAAAVSAEGARLADSSPIGLRADAALPEAHVGLEFGSMATGKAELSATVIGTPGDAGLVWEQSTDGQDWTEIAEERDPDE
ncbi:hypothetical protein ACT3TB_10945 [Micrococcaceae sp. AOP34-BR2-30]